MRERDLIRLRARILMQAHGFGDARHLKGRQRLAYRFLLRGIRGLAKYAKMAKASSAKL